ncbi:MAG: Hint domain-containing protein, partial [Pseudomonadota bacterium]
QHRFLMQGQTEVHAGETLAAAKALTTLPKAREMKGKKQVAYIHFALDQHAVVFANGVPTESCYLGETRLADLSEFERARLTRLFPKIKADSARGYGAPARTIVPPARAEHLLATGQMRVASSVPRKTTKTARNLPL